MKKIFLEYDVKGIFSIGNNRAFNFDDQDESKIETIQFQQSYYLYFALLEFY